MLNTEHCCLGSQLNEHTVYSTGPYDCYPNNYYVLLATLVELARHLTANENGALTISAGSQTHAEGMLATVVIT